MSAPIVIFCFNRPRHLESLFKTLIRNHTIYLGNLYVFIDGPRDSSDVELINDVFVTAENFESHFKSMNIIRREKNIGSAANIIDGITQILEKYSSVIVLEDDLILSKYFLKYMNDTLSKYSNVSNIYHISGFSEFNDYDSNAKAFFGRGMNCWGWATWKDKWDNLETDVDKLIGVMTKDDILKLNFDGSCDFYSQLIQNKIGVLNTWAIFWYVSIFKNGGLCLHPNRALSVNMGNDGSGERVGLTQHHQELFEGDILEYPIEVKEDKFYFAKLKNIYNLKNYSFKIYAYNFIGLLPYQFQGVFYKSYRMFLKVIKISN